MNEDTASLILSNLRERAEKSGSPVMLTSVEVRALQILFGDPAIRSTPGSTSGNDVEVLDLETSRESLGRALQWKPEGTPSIDLILCLDFGTSFSKASASRTKHTDDVPELIDISFGENDDRSPRHLLPSELFIQDECIYFGMAARRKFEIVEANQDQLIDSPKQYMTLGTEVANLHQKPLRPEQDPSQSLSQRDALVLYLAHLNYLAERSLQGEDMAADVRRRYAHPAWDNATADENSTAMARVMAEAIALAKFCPLEFDENMPLSRARDILRQAEAADDKDLPFELLVDPVHEATAAGAGALMATREATHERLRQPYVILDIGAGTTDVAGCLCVNHPEEEYVKVAEVTGARKAIRRAGNNIDSILMSEILERSSFAAGTTEYNRVSQALRKEIRNYKETLFDEGILIAPLESDENVEVELVEFLENEAIKKLFFEIKTIVTNAAFEVVGGDDPVILVATGGGAKLPVVQDMVSNPIRKDGRQLRLRLRDAMPEGLKPVYPQLVNFYPQLAVAIGGSHPDLPRQLNSVSEGIRDPGPTMLEPVYRS